MSIWHATRIACKPVGKFGPGNEENDRSFRSNQCCGELRQTLRSLTDVSTVVPFERERGDTARPLHANSFGPAANAAIRFDKQNQAEGDDQQEAEHEHRQADDFMIVISPAGLTTFDNSSDSTTFVYRFRANVLSLRH